ncbi:NapC/NirT family cytochrome c, partial [Candidatus Aquicultor secundus]
GFVGSVMRVNRRNVIIAAIVVVGLGLVLVVALFVTSAPGYCNTCHEMKSDYQAWKSSVHKTVDCETCHIGPGAGNFIVGKVSALKEVYYHFTNTYQKPINKGSRISQEMPSSRCIPCHRSPGRVSTSTLIFEHDPHIEAGLRCPFCHNRVSHPGVKGYNSRIKMSLCVDCHQKNEVSTECTICHPAAFIRTHPTPPK